MATPILHRAPSASRRAAIVTALAVLLALAGCAAAGRGERAAFDRWLDADRQHYDQQHAVRLSDDDGESEAPQRPGHDLPDSPALDDYLAYAQRHHPGMQAAFHEWKAALERIPQARALMDPQLSYSYVIRAMDTRQTVGLSQTLPWYRKLQARADIALEEAHAAGQAFEQQRLAVLAAVRTAYAEYVYAAQASAVARESQGILTTLQAGVQARFEMGGASYADLLRAQVELESLGDELRTLDAQQAPLAAQLNAAMGRSPALPLPLPSEPLPEPVLAVNETQLLAWLGAHNPELRGLAHSSAARRQGVGFAKLNRIPDLTIGAQYMDAVEDDRDPIELMASINLPIWPERITAERAEALARFGTSTHRHAQRRNELEAQLRLAHFRFVDANRRARLYDATLIPMARDALEASEAAYSSGQVPFESVTNAQTALQQMQLTRHRAAADRFVQWAELVRLVGRELTPDAPSTTDQEPSHAQ